MIPLRRDRSGGSGPVHRARRQRGRRRLLAVPAAAVLAVLLSVVSASATTGTCNIWWKGGTDSQWATVNNWVLSDGSTLAGHVPGSADFVCMAASPSNTTVVLGSGVTSTITGINCRN